jgi:hypothetical protein
MLKDFIEATLPSFMQKPVDATSDRPLPALGVV